MATNKSIAAFELAVEEVIAEYKALGDVTTRPPPDKIARLVALVPPKKRKELLEEVLVPFGFKLSREGEPGHFQRAFKVVYLVEKLEKFSKVRVALPALYNYSLVVTSNLSSLRYRLLGSQVGRSRALSCMASILAINRTGIA